MLDAMEGLGSRHAPRTVIVLTFLETATCRTG
jgi:hypothetical protein